MDATGTSHKARSRRRAEQAAVGEFGRWNCSESLIPVLSATRIKLRSLLLQEAHQAALRIKQTRAPGKVLTRAATPL
ncbi:hypothetical protein NOVOSPHI9U_40439 [Novosphingobium sp. 9U]|nr:hypothetical protein NOVOSPHI9U_40439 [Novosphingobium sp. 9U]